MDNQAHNPENAWVDSKLAKLVPPGDWYPDSKRAYAQFLKRRDSKEAESSSTWVRLSMAAAILASIGLVVTLLPWQALWKPAAKNAAKNAAKSAEKSAEVRLKMPEPVKPPTPIMVPEPILRHSATPALSQPLLSQPALSQRQAQPDPNSDEARRAHILGTASLQSQPTGPGIGGAVTQNVPATQGPGQKPAERVGNGVSSPRAIPPSPQPNYTDDARKAHIQGNVILDVIIRTDGTAKVQKVVQGLGYGLDESAVEAIEKWRFQPGTKDGKAVDVELEVTMGFHLF